VILGTLKVRLQIPGSSSLKEKRKVVKSIKDRLLSLNASVAEVDDLNLWQAATIGIAVVSNEAAHANEMLDKALNIITMNMNAEILNSEMEIIHL